MSSEHDINCPTQSAYLLLKPNPVKLIDMIKTHICYFITY